MKTLQTPVKWKIGFKGTKHTFTGYKSKTVSQEINDLSYYYRYNYTGADFGRALEKYCSNRSKRLRHNIIERIKNYFWSRDPDLEYFQLTELVINIDRKLNKIAFSVLLIECAKSPVRNDTPLTTPTTNDNIGFL